MGVGKKLAVVVGIESRFAIVVCIRLNSSICCCVAVGRSAEGKESQGFNLGIFTSKEPCSYQSVIALSRPVCVQYSIPFPYVPVPVCDSTVGLCLSSAIRTL